MESISAYMFSPTLTTLAVIYQTDYDSISITKTVKSFANLLGSLHMNNVVYKPSRLTLPSARSMGFNMKSQPKSMAIL
ncbi:unnamed protein product [Medioppia subpectinata]|uniref:Uncharacterized protein n=1 Tax=Medioppia subpectinata TaxID=1979941 RepID=A0A7R9PYE6_9ACAR|nr:unnamed protein product [Medioppia subpectinata]CAG2105831.1 unnamed protein product [Medioppia subpectinata]